MILTQLLIGLAAIAVTVVIQAGFMVTIAGWGRNRRLRAEKGLEKAGIVTGVVLWFFLSICAQCWAWAMLFLFLGALETFEEALYFTTVTFTTLGYGDIVLREDWRLLGAFAAANGTIIIGWTTAMVFLTVQRVYGPRPGENSEPPPPR